jgi:hypothetical protein
LIENGKCINKSDCKSFIDGKFCVEYCPINLKTLKNTCVTSCPINYYESLNTPTTCLICETGLLLLNGKCINSCPAPTVEFNGTCL